jgi:hypothetical protein
MSSHMTPLDDQYPNCERTYAELRIYGDTLDPDAITKSIGILPSSSQRRGEVRSGFRNRQRIVSVGGWFLSSEGNVESRDLRRHLDWLLARLWPAATALKNLQAQEGVRMSVTCIWWSRGDGGPALWPEQMGRLADLELECGFEISFYGDDDE